MPDKSDEEIIKEVGLESSKDISHEEALEELNIRDDGDLLEPVEDKDKVIANEDKDDMDTSRMIKEDEIDQDSIPVQKKQPKIYKILIGIAGFLALILIAGAVLYFTGFFDPKPVETPTPAPQEAQKVEVKKEVQFNSEEIDKQALNKKLSMLTKHEIMNKEELEAQENRIKEEERLKKEEEERIIEEKRKEEEARLAAQYAKIEEEKQALEEQQNRIKQQQEDFLKQQQALLEEIEMQKAQFLADIENKKMLEEPTLAQEPVQTMENPPMDEMNNENTPLEEEKEGKIATNLSFMSFINVAIIKGELYKSFLDNIQKVDQTISLCRDDKNRIEIYSGPYYSEKEREKAFNTFIQKGFKEAYYVDLTQEEYMKRCKY